MYVSSSSFMEEEEKSVSMARIHKGGLSTNRSLCTSYDAF